MTNGNATIIVGSARLGSARLGSARLGSAGVWRRFFSVSSLISYNL